MNEKRQRYWYLLADVLSALVAWLLFYAFRRVEVEAQQIGIDLFLPQYNARVVIPLIPVFWVGLYALSGYYNKGEVLFKSRFQELVSTLFVNLIGVVILFFAIVLDDPISGIGFTYFYMAFLLLFVLQFFFTYVFRLFITQRSIAKIQRGELTRRTLVVGKEEAMTMLKAEEKRLLHCGYTIVGYVDTLEELPALIQEQAISNLIIAKDSLTPMQVYQMLSMEAYRNVTIQAVPSQLMWLKGSIELGHVQGVPLIDLTASPMPIWQVNIKRVMDVCFSIVALLLMAPLLLVCALLIGKKPVFKQQRIGLRGQPFTIYKMRSMQLDAEKTGPQLSSEHDPRITPIGRFMRKYRIDELPQFYNVLKGEMSLVGPRPERAFYIQQIVEKLPDYYLLSKVKPGITSLGMVKYGYASTLGMMLERVKFELLYLDKMSLVFDGKILIYTIRTIFMGKGM